MLGYVLVFFCGFVQGFDLLKYACLVEGGVWNTGCWICKTHGGWVRVGECGLVFEVVALWSNGVVWNNGGRVE